MARGSASHTGPGRAVIASQCVRSIAPLGGVRREGSTAEEALQVKMRPLTALPLHFCPQFYRLVAHERMALRTFQVAHLTVKKHARRMAHLYGPECFSLLRKNVPKRPQQFSFFEPITIVGAEQSAAKSGAGYI